jgi:hypothetical protein
MSLKHGYICPHCGAARLNAGRARKSGDYVFTYYEYECGTVLELIRLRTKSNTDYSWSFKCPPKSVRLQ